jgi:tight adherence protein B
MTIELVSALAAGGAIALFALYAVRARQVRPADSRIRRLADRPASARRGLSWDEVRRRGPSSLPLLRNVLADSAWSARMTKNIEQAGLRLRVGEYVLARFGAGLLACAAVWLLVTGTPGLVAGVAAGLLASFLPAIWLSMMRRRRMAQIGRQMPEAVTLLANSLRAGFALQHGIGIITEQMEPPISDEFGRLVVDMNVGSSIEDALTGLLERADTEEVNLMVTAVLIQRTSGGNLAEILETVGESMRERERITGEVRTMTSQQRFSGTVLTFWPIALLGLFSIFNWHQTSVLFTTGAGLALLAVAGIMQVFGYLTIRRILDIDI